MIPQLVQVATYFLIPQLVMSERSDLELSRRLFIMSVKAIDFTLCFRESPDAVILSQAEGFCRAIG